MAESSERARITKELHLTGRSEDPFASAVRATRMPMLITDPRRPDNPIVFANDAFGKLTGYTREEVLGRNCRFLQGTGTSQGDIARIRDAIAERRPIEIDLLNYRKDGSAFWNRVLISPVFDGEEEPTFFFASQFDVTPERDRLKELEQDRSSLQSEIGRRLDDLASTEERLRFTLEAGRLGAWTLDLERGRLVASRLCKANFGRSPSDSFTYDELKASIHPGDFARWQEAVGAALKPPGLLAVEYRTLHPDGCETWVEIRGQTSFDPSGVPVSMAGVSLDISARRRAVLDLQELEDHRAMAVAVGDVGIFDVDLVTGAIHWDKQLRRFHGMSPTEPVTLRKSLDAVHPDDRERVGAFLDEIQTGKRSVFEVQYRVEDGHERHLFVKGRALRDEAGKLVRLVGAARDVTERVADEERRQMLNAELSHRLKNMFAIVRSLVSQTLRGTPDVEAARDRLTQRIEALSHAHELLLTGQTEAASVRGIVEGVARMHDGEGRFALDGPDALLAQQDALSLSLIMHELATNAFKHGALSEPGGRVAISWRLEESAQASGPSLRIEWAEQGGPPVNVPEKLGFGSRLLRMGMSRGESEIVYAPEGLRYTVLGAVAAS